MRLGFNQGYSEYHFPWSDIPGIVTLLGSQHWGNGGRRIRIKVIFGYIVKTGNT